MTTNSLFNEFDEHSAKAWKQKIQFDLKGADYNDTLIWQSLEGIHVKPFYHSDDFKTAFKAIPDQPTTWEICQEVFIDDVSIANHIAIDAMERGAEAILFTAEKEFDIPKLFHQIDLTNLSLQFNLQFLDAAFIQKLQKFLSESNSKASYNVDILGNLATTGNWFHSYVKDHQILTSLTSEMPSEMIVSVDTTTAQNAGANQIQQLAYALTQANEYLNHLHQAKQDLQHTTVSFKMAIGGNYFFEIAKLRALRILFSRLAKEYHANEHCRITATPTTRDKTLYDYNVNMLRTTTQYMSAILGGANTICSLPYDAIYHKSNEFGARIARNQLLIMKAESYLDTVSNAADGSYYIESLTKQLAEKALALFKEVEANGGYLKQLKEGNIQRKIKESQQKEQQLFDEGSLVLVGTNKHPNPADRMKESLDLYPFLKMNKRKTVISPIIPRRLSEQIEKERLDHE